MKKVVSMICVLALSVLLTCSVSAASAPRLVDDADLLTPDEEAALIARLDTVSETYQVDVVIVTTPSTNGQTPQAFADDYFDYNGYGFGDSHDGVLFLLSMEERDWYISTCGLAIEAFSDDTIAYIGDNMLSDLSVGLYASAFDTFINECEYYIDGAVNGFPFPFFMNLFISLAIGFVVALIATGIMRSKLKSVRPQPSAVDYVRKDSLKVTGSNELFLYRQVARVKKSSSSSGGSSTHTSSSGRTHGGGGGKF